MCVHTQLLGPRIRLQALFLLLFKTYNSDQEIYLGNLSSLLCLSLLDMILQNGVYMIFI